MYMLIMFMYGVCPVLILMDCASVYCGVWVDEVLCDICGVSVHNSVMYKCN